MDAASVSRFLGVLALLAGPASLVLLALRDRPATAPLRANGTALAAAVATTAMLGSLWYSEVAGFVPCELCWFQRIAMYPLAIMLTIAAVRRDESVRPYARVLAGGGLLVSLWHVAVQRVPALSEATSCTAEAPCTQQWVDTFGFLSIPAMAGCGFLAVLVLTSLGSHHTSQAAARTEPRSEHVTNRT